MLEHLQEILRKKCQLHPSAPTLVGVSGGPDSLCLWDVLHRLGYPTIVAHYNHGLRPEAEEEAESVRQAAATAGVPFVFEQAKIAEIAERESLSLEEAARTARYSFLFSQAQRLGAQAVAVAHTADDQVETVLMHLLRGAGLSGLGGMSYRAIPNPWSQKIPLIRPLLDIWRPEVLVYCAEHALQPAYDATNLDQAYFRNRLRFDLIPSLEQYNPAARRLIWQTVIRAGFWIIENAVVRAWKPAVEVSPAMLRGRGSAM
jgi:tRNA(Ile)-lysidine synthase